MRLLTALIVRNRHILGGIYFVFLKKTSYNKLEKLPITNLDIGEKIGKERQILVTFSSLAPLILS